MRTHSSSYRIVESSTILRRRNKRSQQQVVSTIVEIPVVTMVDNRMMEEMLQAPTEGHGDAIVVPDILAENFEIRTGYSHFQANHFYGFESNNPHDHIRSFNRITSTLKFRNVPNDAIKLMLFPYSLEGGAKIWYEKEPPRSILTWGDLHEHDSLNAVAGGNLLSKTPRDALTIIENKSKVRYSRNKPVASKVSTNSSGSSSSTDARIDKLTDTISNLVETFNKKMTTLATVKAVAETCVTCGGAHPHYDCIATDSNTLSSCTATGTYNQGGPQNRASNQMGPPGFPPTEFQSTMRSQNNKIDQNQNEIKNMLSCLMNNPLGSGPLPINTIANLRGGGTGTRGDKGYGTKNIQPSMVQTQVPIDEPVVAPKPKPTIPYPSRSNKQKLREKDDNLALKFIKIFRNIHFNLSFADALLYMPKFALMFKSHLNNKEKLFDLATTPVNENCLTVILKKLLEKLGDLGKFLIPCDFLELDKCLALADLGASINLMPLSIWKNISLPELTPIRMILELADRSTTRPANIAKDVFVKLGKFHFPINFVVVDYVVDPRVPLILERPFLRTGRALINVYCEELTLRVDDEAITFKVGQTLKYSYNDAKLINQIDVIDVACEEYVQEVLGFLEIPKSGNPTTTSEPITASSSPSFTPFKGSDFILEEIETFLRTSDELPNLDDDYYDTDGDILYLENLLNEDLSLNLPPVKTEDLKQVDATMTKPLIEEPPKLKLKELPPHLEYAFRLTRKTKKRPPSLALMERLLTDVCLSVYVMLRARFKGQNGAGDGCRSDGGCVLAGMVSGGSGEKQKKRGLCLGGKHCALHSVLKRTTGMEYFWP
nr:reverse transcriptase domain-containing protein [Tanacetum cinerariifolium]